MNSAPQRLVQEFVRIRQSREQDREAILLSLLSRSVDQTVPSTTPDENRGKEDVLHNDPCC